MDVKAILASSGFDLAWLVAMEAKHGAAILSIITDFMNQGLTPAFIISVVDKVHPLLIDILYQVFSAAPLAAGKLAAAKLGANADAVGGVVSGTLDDIIASDLSVFLVQKLIDILPTLGLSGWKLSAAGFGLQLLLTFLQNAKKPAA